MTFINWNWYSVPLSGSPEKGVGEGAELGMRDVNFDLVRLSVGRVGFNWASASELNSPNKEAVPLITGPVKGSVVKTAKEGSSCHVGVRPSELEKITSEEKGEELSGSG